MNGPDEQPSRKIKYVLIKATSEIPGDINQPVIDRLAEPLRAIAAFYSALGGSFCFQDTSDVETCGLTTAPGLGNQGSEQHKALIRKWFPDDDVASGLIRQDCYLRPDDASTFSDYAYLSMTKQGDTVTINFSLLLYDHGKITYRNGPDKLTISGGRIKVIKRQIWE